MAPPAAFNQLSVHMGFNPDTQAVIVAEGYNNVELFAELDGTEVDNMFHILIGCPTPVVAPLAMVPNIVFPIRAAANLKALCYWTREQRCIGCDGNHEAADERQPGIC
jgi:hypothetical protein